jgi:hypothetical protein
MDDDDVQGVGTCTLVPAPMCTRLPPGHPSPLDSPSGVLHCRRWVLLLLLVLWFWFSVGATHYPHVVAGDSPSARPSHTHVWSVVPCRSISIQTLVLHLPLFATASVSKCRRLERLLFACHGHRAECERGMGTPAHPSAWRVTTDPFARNLPKCLDVTTTQSTVAVDFSVAWLF